MKTESETKLILLGTASPRVSPDKFQTSFALMVDGVMYMIDCGSGAHERLVQACVKYGNGLTQQDMTHLFLTHLHPDHTADLPSILIAPYVLGREGPHRGNQLKAEPKYLSISRSLSNCPLGGRLALL